MLHILQKISIDKRNIFLSHEFNLQKHSLNLPGRLPCRPVMSRESACRSELRVVLENLIRHLRMGAVHSELRDLDWMAESI